MSAVYFPLSGPGNFAPWLGQFTVNLGQSFNNNVETTVIDRVASFGKQLGRIGDVIIVLISHIKLDGLPPDEARAIRDLQTMLHEIANVKDGHDLKHVLRPCWPELVG